MKSCVAIFVACCCFATRGLPATSPLRPEEELASFHFADRSLTAELVAGEPDISSPVAISWDADGRLFVAEMRDYPNASDGGVIRLLEDRDGDGRYETSTIFADKLPFPNGVLPWNGGVLVTAAPDILFLKDTDGDGRADERRVLFTGFGEGNQQLRVNGLVWGLDGWIYGANGRSDGEVHRPGEARKTSLRGHDFRFRPDTGEFEAIAGRSQFGLARDDWGNRFLSWNTIPIRHDAIPERYLLRNPRLAVTEAIQNVLPAEDDNRVFPMTPAPQTFNNESTSHFNALAGLHIYRGDALPAFYRGNAFVGETLRNLVHRRVLEPSGGTFIAKRGEPQTEFLASTDPWFHPVNFATGPDGALYVVDFYRQWVEHPGFVPERMRRDVPWRTGSEHGRIWRMKVKGEEPKRKLLNRSGASTAELIQRLEHPNGWQRDTAQRLLIERRADAVAPLVDLARRSSKPETRVVALSTLDVLGALDESTLLRALADSHPRVRETAVRLTEPRLNRAPALVDRLTKLVSDQDARVRLQAILSLGEAPAAESFPALTQAAANPLLDRLAVTAIRSSAGERSWPLLKSLRQKDFSESNTNRLDLIHGLALDVGAGGAEEDQTAFLASLNDWGRKTAGVAPVAVFAGFAQGLSRNASWEARVRAWTESTDGSRAASNLVALAREKISSTPTSAGVRNLAWKALARLGTREANGLLLECLFSPRASDAPVGAVAAITEVADETLLREVFAGWNRLPIDVRRKLLLGTTRSAAGLAVLVDMMEAGRVPPVELDAVVRQNLSQTKSAGLKARIERLLGPAASPDRQKVFENFSPALKLAGNAPQGAATFARLCLQCHALQGRGQPVGPDLAGIRSRPKEAVLLDILDPSRQVPSDFVSYVVTTSDDSLLGLIVSENAAGLTLRRAGIADEIIPRSRIKEVQASGRSLMPDNLEAGLTLQDMADLLEFLREPTNLPDDFFDQNPALDLLWK